MSNSWKKLSDAWGVQCDEQHAPGDVVTVVNRTGEAKQVTLGANIQTNAYGFVYAVAQAPKAAAPQATVGELSGVLALFRKAQTHLKRPAIVLGVPEIDATQDVEGWGIRLTIAGPKAKVPGSLTVTTSAFETINDYGEPARAWLGRVLVDGTYQPARAANGRTDAIAARLRELAQDPAKVAAEHGRLTGRCCFCNRALSDERSTAVGYGETCASHYGVAWGSKPTFFGEAV